MIQIQTNMLRNIHIILLTLFHLFRNEEQLKYVDIIGTYFEKLQEANMMNMVNRNKKKIDHFIDLIDEAPLKLQADFRSNCDAYFQKEIDAVEQNILNTVENLFEDHGDWAVVIFQDNNTTAFFIAR